MVDRPEKQQRQNARASDKQNFGRPAIVKLNCALHILTFAFALYTVMAPTKFGLAQETPEITLAPDKSWRAAPPRPAEYDGAVRRSYYVSMRDGVRIAVDVWLPTGLSAETRLPTILEQTRYYRSILLNSDEGGPCRAARQSTIELFVTRGYAYVVVDVRGSGASFGTRKSEYSDTEVDDGAEIVDWITRQAWSNGVIGAQGQSYVGTTAELLASKQHPAVRAVAPSFSGYDFYSEIAFPGGVKNTEFGRAWSDMISLLDQGTPPPGSPIKSVCPVDSDRGGSALRAAIAEHAGNRTVWPIFENTEFRDDAYQGVGIDEAGVFHRQALIDQANIPVHAIVGWYDSGYALGAFRRLATSSSTQNSVLIGPWNHGARYFYAPGVRAPTLSSFDLAGEKLAFFDRVLKGLGGEETPRIRYFTTGANEWRTSDVWPPRNAHVQSFYLGKKHGLMASRPLWRGADDFVGGGAAQSGPGDRWRTTTGPYPVFYPERSQEDEALLTYETAPLPADLDITGDPVLRLYLSANAADADVFVYLEEVTGEGAVNYVTEGVLKASRRKGDESRFLSPAPTPTFRREDAAPLAAGDAVALAIPLLPLSHRFEKGSRIRIAISPADRSHFLAQAPEDVRWRVFRSLMRPSRIELPVAAAEFD